MKITFVAQYTISGYPSNCELEVTMWVPMNEKIGTIMIHDKDIDKIIVRDFNPKFMTVHKNFAIGPGNAPYTAEQMRNQRVNNPNISYPNTHSQNSKELLCQVYERDLFVPAGTFDKIIKAFKIFPDPVELLFE